MPWCHAWLLMLSPWLSPAAIWMHESTTVTSFTVRKVSAILDKFLGRVLTYLLWICHKLLRSSTHHIVWRHIPWHVSCHILRHILRHVSWHTSSLCYLILLFIWRMEELALAWTLKASSWLGHVWTRCHLIILILGVSSATSASAIRLVSLVAASLVAAIPPSTVAASSPSSRISSTRVSSEGIIWLELLLLLGLLKLIIVHFSRLKLL